MSALATAFKVHSSEPMARDQTLFGLLMRTRETSIAGTYVQGRRL
ncbi:hypothetical protein AAHS21_02915 [Mycobacterium sp. 050272]